MLPMQENTVRQPGRTKLLNIQSGLTDCRQVAFEMPWSPATLEEEYPEQSYVQRAYYMLRKRNPYYGWYKPLKTSPAFILILQELRKWTALRVLKKGMLKRNMQGYVLSLIVHFRHLWGLSGYFSGASHMYIFPPFVAMSGCPGFIPVSFSSFSTFWGLCFLVLIL